MFRMLNKEDLLEWQIWWYGKRLNEATTTEAKRFLRAELHRLKTKKTKLYGKKLFETKANSRYD